MGLKAREATKTGRCAARTIRSRLEPRCPLAEISVLAALADQDDAGVGLDLGDGLDHVAMAQGGW